jgi:UDP-N-acetylmuramate--alanine ligase
MSYDLNKAKKIHFVGIGGIGISAIARMMLAQGKDVTGSDISRSTITDDLKRLGAKIFIDLEKNPKVKSRIKPRTDLAVRSIAITKDNPDIKEARKLGIKILTYPQTLALLTKDYYTIAVSGTHGKTTTTAMLAKVCIDNGLDPTVIVGSLIKESGSNFIKGKSGLFIVEACEYKKSFLNLTPNMLIITNIDNDHLDYYKNIKNIQKAFRALALKLPKDGFLICNRKDPRLKPVLRGLKCKIIDYVHEKTKLKLKIPGDHNIENAKAALAAARLLKAKPLKSKKSLENYKGAWRRAEYKGKIDNGAIVYDDYAHHPTEIRATLLGFKEKYPTKKIVAVFQPHLYSRTKSLLDDLCRSFDHARSVILLPIYAAREKEDKSINSSMLVRELIRRNIDAIYLNDFDVASEYIGRILNRDTLLITMGAGDIYKVGERIIKGPTN